MRVNFIDMHNLNVLVELASYCSETVVFARDDSPACKLKC
jgi:hypothetical protein